MTPAEKYNETSAKFDTMISKAAKTLKEVVGENKLANGMVVESVRLSEEYRAAKRNFDRVFNAAREYAKNTPAKVKREAANLRREKMLVNH